MMAMHRLNAPLFIATLFLLFTQTRMRAQEMEYKMEIGPMAGMGFYLGDANLAMYKGINFDGGLLARYKFNPRTALKMNLIAGSISGDASKSDNWFPESTVTNPKFKKLLIDLGCQYEVNFFGFGTGQSFKGTKRIAPYIQLGLGFTYCNTFTLNIPIGLGVKYKLSDRVNVGLDWTMRFAFSDKLDGIADPYKIKGGFLKNKDSYNYTLLYVTYDFMPRLRKCNND